jgi:hypothetical protein
MNSLFNWYKQSKCTDIEKGKIMLKSLLDIESAIIWILKCSDFAENFIRYKLNINYESLLIRKLDSIQFLGSCM